jgi:hypothetical protein
MRGRCRTTISDYRPDNSATRRSALNVAPGSRSRCGPLAALPHISCACDGIAAGQRSQAGAMAEVDELASTRRTTRAEWGSDAGSRPSLPTGP